MIKYEDFKKLDIRVGKIIKAEEIKEADKLVKLTVDTGEERTIIAGIRKSYEPEILIGKEIIVLVNLEPKEMFGIKSEGMLLAATGEKPILLTPDKEAKPGTKIS